MGQINLQAKNSFQFSSVTPLFLTLCDPMDRSTPGFPVHHQLLELAQLMSIKHYVLHFLLSLQWQHL